MKPAADVGRRLHFISHPNVLIDPAVPVPRWPLSALGRSRMKAGLAQPWVAQVTAVYASTEQKSLDAAHILASHLALDVHTVADLGENDRSATGFLTPAEFEAVADEFFAFPERSVRGWERAVDAQQRIVRAVTAIAQQDRSGGDLAIVSHGAVGTLLYCHLADEPIARVRDQPPNGGGNFYTFTLHPSHALSWWAAIDPPA